MCELSRRMSRIVLSVWRLGKYTAFLCPATCHRQSTCRAPRNAPNTERRVQNLKGYSLVLHVWLLSTILIHFILQTLCNPHFCWWEWWVCTGLKHYEHSEVFEVALFVRMAFWRLLKLMSERKRWICWWSTPITSSKEVRRGGEGMKMWVVVILWGLDLEIAYGLVIWHGCENERPGIQQGNGWRSSFHFWDGFQVVKMFIFQGVDVFFSFFWGGTFWIFIVTSCLFTSQGIPLEKAGSWLDIMNTRKLVNDQSFPFYAQLFGPPGSPKITGQAVVS